MGWVKDANRKYKFGRYEGSRRGFRIYCLIRRNIHVYYEDRPDGRYRITDFIPGKFIAIDKNGLTFTRLYITELWTDIDFYLDLGYLSLSSNKHQQNG